MIGHAIDAGKRLLFATLRSVFYPRGRGGGSPAVRWQSVSVKHGGRSACASIVDHSPTPGKGQPSDEQSGFTG